MMKNFMSVPQPQTNSDAATSLPPPQQSAPRTPQRLHRVLSGGMANDVFYHQTTDARGNVGEWTTPTFGTAALTGRIKLFCNPVATQDTELHVGGESVKRGFGYLSLV